MSDPNHSNSRLNNKSNYNNVSESQSDLDLSHLPKLSAQKPQPTNETSSQPLEQKMVDDFINPKGFDNSMPPPNVNHSPNLSSHVQQCQRLSDSEEASLVHYNHLTYLLYVLSFFTAGLLWIVPIVMNYYRRREADGTWLETHFDWQIKMFWYSLVFGLIGMVLVVISFGGLGISALAESGGGALGSVGLGFLGAGILFFSIIWHIYRIIRGWIALVDKRPVP